MVHKNESSVKFGVTLFCTLGTYLLANSGVLISAVQDVVATGDAGRTFLKCDSGMTEILR